MVYLSRPYHFKVFKSCLPQISLGPYLNTWTHTRLEIDFKMKPFYTNGKLAKQYFQEAMKIVQKVDIFGNCIEERNQVKEM